MILSTLQFMGFDQFINAKVNYNIVIYVGYD